MPSESNAEQFIQRLEAQRSPEQLEKLKHLKSNESDIIIGVRMGQIFALAKEFIEMPPAEIEKLLESPIHEARVGALSIMDKQARRKQTPESHRKEIYDLYMRRHDRINNWDLVDLAAAYVVGGYLYDKPRDILYKLARSEDVWERRTAIVSTGYFIRQGEVDDAFNISEMLLNDKEDLIHKATGWMLREAGKVDRPGLLQFLDRYAATMPRPALRYAIEHLDEDKRVYYMSLKRGPGGR
jgi:3-methyladenine DNA glycosylase AlkD